MSSRASLPTIRRRNAKPSTTSRWRSRKRKKVIEIDFRVCVEQGTGRFGQDFQIFALNNHEICVVTCVIPLPIPARRHDSITMLATSPLVDAKVANRGSEWIKKPFTGYSPAL